LSMPAECLRAKLKTGTGTKFSWGGKLVDSSKLKRGPIAASLKQQSATGSDGGNGGYNIVGKNGWSKKGIPRGVSIIL